MLLKLNYKLLLFSRIGSFISICIICIDIILNGKLSAYLRFQILFQLYYHLKIPPFIMQKVYKKIPTISHSDWRCVPKVLIRSEQINHNSCERAISLNKNYKYIHFPLTCHYLMRPVNKPYLASIFFYFLSTLSHFIRSSDEH